MHTQRTTLRYPNDKEGRKALEEKVISFKANGWKEISRQTEGKVDENNSLRRGLSFFRKPDNPDQNIIVRLERDMGSIDL